MEDHLDGWVGRHPASTDRTYAIFAHFDITLADTMVPAAYTSRPGFPLVSLQQHGQS